MTEPTEPIYATYLADPDDIQVKWGTCADPRGLLTVGEEYEVERIEIHSWHTKIFLKGIDSGRGFNDVSFEYKNYSPHIGNKMLWELRYGGIVT